MSHIAVALDLGTSGFRAQALDLDTGEALSTAITTRHPLPGANVIDHLHFALEMTVERAGDIVVEAIDRVIKSLRVDPGDVARLAVCGNPIQLSLFQRMEIRDLAFAGKRKLESLGVGEQNRDARVVPASSIAGLPIPASADVLIPPAVQHEIGADALAMLIQTGMLDRDETCITTDYGTNAEMALFHEGRILTGSTAAGPALEGQQIGCGMLAMPGAISDLMPEERGHRVMVLDAEMLPADGPLVDLKAGTILEHGMLVPVGITGTGTVAVLSEGIRSGAVRIPRIETLDTELHLSEALVFTEEDLVEAGKAIGSVRAGHLTLCREAGIEVGDIQIAYMSGASGTYVDPLKAQHLGMIPPRVERIYQVGNTSLAMARDLALEPKKLDMMSELARTLRQTHCMFAASKVFERIYILELSYWTEGMPVEQYDMFLKKYGFPQLLHPEGEPEIVRTVRRDIDDLGLMGLATVSDLGQDVSAEFEGCVACYECVQTCPEHALTLKEGSEPPEIILDQSLCNGVACRKCERCCPEKVIKLDDFFVKIS